jgi:hypothetical protein
LALPEPANQLCDPHHKTPDFRMLSPAGMAKASPALRGGADHQKAPIASLISMIERSPSQRALVGKRGTYQAT